MSDLAEEARQIALEVKQVSPVPYTAVNGYWVCLVKWANLFPSAGDEHEQVAALLRGIPRVGAKTIVTAKAVDDLINLEPPLETVLAHPREILKPMSIQKAMARLRTRRERDPKAGLMALLEIIQEVRNKREHGFKTPAGPRDHEILSASAAILRSICDAVEEIAIAQLVRAAHGA